MKRATIIAHEKIAAHLKLGDHAIDATVGNGYDTLFLAEKVGAEGHVTGFDIQKEALASARRRLADAGVDDLRVTLRHASHAEMLQHTDQPVAAVMFNLGYLPGGNQEKITCTASTLPALDQAVSLLQVEGILTCVCYPGHPGGLEEAESILTWAAALDQEIYRVEMYNEKGRHEGRPFLVSLTRVA